MVKYGEHRFLEPMLRQGLVRISPAASYSDPSLNAAIRDDELSVELDINEWTAGPYSHLLATGAANRFTSFPRLDLNIRSPSNYYVFCTAHRLSARLIMDFGGDSCLVIHDPDEFVRRLQDAVGERLQGWTTEYRDVEYYDPAQTNVIEVGVLYSKHFRYAYQHETRVAWFPPSPIAELEPLHLELGSLADIAELVLPTPAAL
jgi:hypothetical protein